MDVSRLDNRTVEQSDKPLLVDFEREGEVVAVCFGAYETMRMPPFEFYGRCKKLEKLSGRTINKVLVRDVSNSWYHYGVPGVGRDIAETIDRLRSLIARMKPSRVVAIGQSMGAFGAVLYGALLDVDEVIAFGPMAVFESAKSYYFSDGRWGDVVRRVEAAAPAVFYQDMPRLIESLPGGRTRFHVYYGTKPTEEPDDKTKYVEAVNYDAVHGYLYSRTPRVAAHPVRWSVHRVPAYLRKVGFIDELLLHRILGIPYSPESFEDLPVEQGWLDWMRLNYTMGFDAEAVLHRVGPFGHMTPRSVATAFDRVRRNVLRGEL